MKTCLEHSREITLFCKACTTPLCTRCAPSHCKHDIWPIEACEDLYNTLLTQATQALTYHNDQVKALKAQLYVHKSLEDKLESQFEAQLVCFQRAKLVKMENLKRIYGNMQGELKMRAAVMRNCLKVVNLQIVTEENKRKMVKTRINELKSKLDTEGMDLKAVFREIQALKLENTIGKLPEIPRITLYQPDFRFPQQGEDIFSQEEVRWYRLYGKRSEEMGNS